MAERKVIFGKYEMGRLLGKGTFAKVYFGKNLTNGEGVAIKVISKSELKKKGMMEQIKREISIMKRVKNPNVVDLKEVMATKTKIYFVMEYVKGGELFAKVANGKLKEDVARRYFQQLISAVEYCHSCGVSHRDLKPENLLLDENGDLKISDFGLSALPEHVRDDGLLHTRCGTPAYLAPEVLSFRGRGYGGAEADIWSCGVVLYVLLAGFLPFDDENMMKMYKKIATAEYKIPPWFSQRATRMIKKLLVVNPKKRVDIPAVMGMPWFKKNFEPPKRRVLELEDLKRVRSVDLEFGDVAEDESDVCLREKITVPNYLNAFELISSMAPGLDISGLFEEVKRKDVGSVFTSKHSASEVVKEIAGSARRSGWKVGKKKEFKLKIEGGVKGKGKMTKVTAEVFQLGPDLTMVEFEKSISSDVSEFNRFLDEEVRPALKDIVCTWQSHDAHPETK